jgi:hypothetical protein
LLEQAHTTTLKRRGPNAEKGLVPNLNKTKKLETEHSQFMDYDRIFMSIATEYHLNFLFYTIFCD